MKKYFNINKDAYDEMAPFYKIRGDRGDFKIKEDIVNFADFIQKEFQYPHILEIGPGAGLVLKYFSERGFKTTAIDISNQMISVAAENSPKTEYICGNFLDYDFKNKKFDALFAKAIFHLFSAEDAYSLINKAHGLLVDKGLMYLSLFIRNKPGEEVKPKDMEGHIFYRYNKDWTKKELKDILNNSSFKVINNTILNHNEIRKWSGILQKKNKVKAIKTW
jgi:cyclopropane fatty-acyl-phospholipid synthase-like methyltransferase